MPDNSSSFPHPLYEKYVLKPFYVDAEKYYYEPMLAANRAHVIMLYKSNIITEDNAKDLLSALQKVDDGGLANLSYQSGVEDLFFAIERQLIEHIGAAHGGNLQLARSRNDLGYALTRLALRPLILDAIERTVELRSILIKVAEEHLKTLMPGYTHTQPAQPTTMAHYLAGILAFLERDTARLKFAYDTNNQSPLGAAALTGTGFPINRDLSAQLLGFDGIMASTYDGIATSDNLTDVAGALSTMGVNLSRFTRDMLFWATQESGAIRIDNSFIQISSIMPQKRNPVVLEHIRARISRMIAQAHGIVIQCHNIPYGDTQDIEDEIFPMLFGSLETTSDILHLYGAVMATLHINVDHLRNRAISGFTTVTELADTLVRHANLPFRQAHSIVSSMVTHAIENNLAPTDLTSELITQIAQEKLGIHVELSDELLQQALDPEAFVNARTVKGGSAPSATKSVLLEQGVQLDADMEWLIETNGLLDSADSLLQQEIDAIL